MRRRRRACSSTHGHRHPPGLVADAPASRACTGTATRRPTSSPAGSTASTSRRGHGDPLCSGPRTSPSPTTCTRCPRDSTVRRSGSRCRRRDRGLRLHQPGHARRARAELEAIYVLEEGRPGARDTATAICRPRSTTILAAPFYRRSGFELDGGEQSTSSGRSPRCASCADGMPGEKRMRGIRPSSAVPPCPKPSLHRRLHAHGERAGERTQAGSLRGHCRGLAEVAAEAQVSPSTVSHALNGTRAVRAETRERVVQAADVSGTCRTAWRRRRARRSSDSSSTASRPRRSPAESSKGRRRRRASATRCSWWSIPRRPRTRAGPVRALADRGVDGILLARSSHQEIDRPHGIGDIPVVLIDAVPTPGWAVPAVAPDERAIASPRSRTSSPRAINTSRSSTQRTTRRGAWRHAGFRSAVEWAGLYDMHAVVERTPPTPRAAAAWGDACSSARPVRVRRDLLSSTTSGDGRLPGRRGARARGAS